MTLPDYQSLMLPLLTLTKDMEEHTLPEVTKKLAEVLSISKEELGQLLPSGSPVFRNRVGWAKAYLKKAGLLENTKRGVFKITQDGLSLLATSPLKINNQVLEQYPAFKDFKKKKNDKNDKQSVVNETSTADEFTPEEALGNAYLKLREELESEILSQAKCVSPNYFEQLVVDLLVKMGYGGNRQDAAKAVGKSGDEGIDGVINEDVLGLDVVYIQAKQWQNTVTRPELQKFTGALAGKQAKKGVFITTSNFSTGAIDYVSKVDARIILIDGVRLAKLMVDHEVGVSTIGIYAVKKIDHDYFDE